MPQIVNLGAIRLYMYYGDHLPPHFHVLEDDVSCMVTIEELQVWAGTISPRGLRIALEWARINQDLLREKWQQFNEEE